MDLQVEQFGEPMVRRRRPLKISRNVSIREICNTLSITPMTISIWRAGSPVRRQLPVRTEPIGPSGERHRVIIREDDLVDFLEEYRPDLLDIWKRNR
jgi:hypothetical protein